MISNYLDSGSFPIHMTEGGQQCIDFRLIFTWVYLGTIEGLCLKMITASSPGRYLNKLEVRLNVHLSDSL